MRIGIANILLGDC